MPAKYADIAVPYMVDLLCRYGVPTSELVAKIAGGACMFGDKEVGQIGDATVAAVLNALKNVGISLGGSAVGGTGGRRITFSAEDGGLTIQVFGAPAFTL
jgi:chemotaxis protein CheD